MKDDRCIYPGCGHPSEPYEHPAHGDSSNKAEDHGWRTSRIYVEGQLAQMAAQPPRTPQASIVHYYMAFGLKACDNKPSARYGGKGKQSSTNNLSHTTCNRCLHAVINLATAQLDAVAKRKEEARA